MTQINLNLKKITTYEQYREDLWEENQKRKMCILHKTQRML